MSGRPARPAGGRQVVAVNPALAEAFGAPGLATERSLALSGAWFNEVCLWLGCPIGSLGAIGWPMVLFPEVIDSRYRLHPAALHVYQRVEWEQAVPTGPFDVSGGVGWLSERDGSIEVALSTVARRDGADLARNLLVARMPGELASHGVRDLPARPDVGEVRRRRTLVVDSASVRHFAELAGTRYPIHDDERYAWSRGYPAILVQGLLLYLTQLHFSGIGPVGRAEMWFRRVVPAGSLLELGQSVDDPTLWAFRLIGGGAVAAIARIASPGPGSLPIGTLPIGTLPVDSPPAGSR